jgi:DNA-binding transcriptional ArsR family regulator
MTYEWILNALSDPTRRGILTSLRGGPSTVGALADRLPVSQPAVSQHLKVLREAGLVRAEKRGVRRIYHLETQGFAPLRSYLESFWDDALYAYRRSFETTAGEEGG